jgi:hypothetical protein
VVEAVISLSVNDRGRLEYPAGGMSVPHLAGHRYVAFGFTWVEPMKIQEFLSLQVFDS